MASAHEVTRILKAVGRGDPGAMAQLFPLVYDELRARAQALSREQRAGHTLQATALVHEAYLKLVDHCQAEWKDRLHFFAVASKVMRHILADHAKHHGRKKRGGGWARVSLGDAAAALGTNKQTDVSAIDEALGELESFDPQRAQIVEMRFFGGMTEDEIAEVLGVSRRTVERQWCSARTWLYSELMNERS